MQRVARFFGKCQGTAMNFLAWAVRTRVFSYLGAFGVLLSTVATAQGLIVTDQPASDAGPLTGPTMVQVVSYPDGMYALPEVAPAVPSCFRIGRCSAYDLYRFKDRPNRLSRLAPEAPPATVSEAAWVPYRWSLIPATPEENIVPPYRASSMVRDEYRAVSRPIDASE